MVFGTDNGDKIIAGVTPAPIMGIAIGFMAANLYGECDRAFREPS
jgi:hypothetical protein